MFTLLPHTTEYKDGLHWECKVCETCHHWNTIGIVQLHQHFDQHLLPLPWGPASVCLSIIVPTLVTRYDNIITLCYLYWNVSKYPGIITFITLSYLGIVTSITFVILYSRADSDVVQIKKKNILLYSLCLLLFYPLVPIALTIAYLVTKNEKHHERATMSKFFAGFLDHGPQFVLRLVVVVLIGLSQGGVYQRWPA